MTHATGDRQTAKRRCSAITVQADVAQWSADVRAASGRKFNEKTERRFKLIWERHDRPFIIRC
jgi:hypothetical protein